MQRSLSCSIAGAAKLELFWVVMRRMEEPQLEGLIAISGVGEGGRGSSGQIVVEVDRILAKPDVPGEIVVRSIYVSKQTTDEPDEWFSE